jgi:uridine kinase
VGGGASQVAAVVRATLGSAPRLGSARLVCIDGPAASGKTTLAAAVEPALRRHGCTAVTLHLDDLYEGWSGLSPGLERRLLAQVFEPLARGLTGRWQRYDWYAEEFAEWHDLEPPDVLLVEGCGSGSLSYARYRSVLVWLEAPPEVRTQRWLERDLPGVAAHRDQWVAAETAHFARNATREHAEVRLESR